MNTTTLNVIEAAIRRITTDIQRMQSLNIKSDRAKLERLESDRTKLLSDLIEAKRKAQQ